MEMDDDNNFLIILILTLLLMGIFLLLKGGLVFYEIGFQELMFLIVVLMFVPFTYMLIKKGKLDGSSIGFSFGRTKKLTLALGFLGGVLPFVVVLITPSKIESFSYLKFIRGVFLAPVWEEYLFRALVFSCLFLLFIKIMNLFSKYKNSKSMRYYFLFFAMLLTVAIFTRSHNEYGWGILSASISFTVVFYFSRSIVSSIISHFVYNLFVWFFYMFNQGILSF
jgi:membrane protease YdiL (CAAX protease family)